MSWYKVELAAGDYSDRLISIQDSFDVLYIVNMAPADAALFESGDGNGSGELYFSPGAFRIAPTFILDHDGKPCARPAPGPLTLLVGQLASVDALLK